MGLRGRFSDMAITLTSESISEYQICELYYKYKHIDHEKGVIPQQQLLLDRFNLTLKRTVAYFFYRQQAETGKVPSYRALLNRWEKLWFPKNMNSYKASTQSHPITKKTDISYSNTAAIALRSFHEYFSNREGIPVAVDDPFLIPLYRDVRLQGNFDLVFKEKDFYRVVRWIGETRGSQNRPKHTMTDFAALKLAWEHRHKRKIETVYSSYNLIMPSGFKAETPTVEDANALKYWAAEIAEKRAFVPRRGYTSLCNNCPFDKPCSEFVFDKEVLKARGELR